MERLFCEVEESAVYDIEVKVIASTQYGLRRFLNIKAVEKD